MEAIKLTIINWDKFNPSSSFKTPYWFRVNIHIVSSKSLFGLSADIKWVWICLLSEAMRNRSATFELSLAWASQHWGIKQSDIAKAIDSLNKNGLLRVDSESTQSGLRVDSEPTPPHIHTNIQTNKQTITSPTVFDFESLYSKYPRKLGKTKGIQKLKTLVKNPDDFKRVSDAIDRFISYHRRENTGPQFIPHFSTFMNSITDWYDDKAGSVAFPKPKVVQYKPMAEVISQTKDSETYSLKPEELKNLIKKTIKPIDPEPA